jgi:gliding motility-associated-like protein
MVGLILSMKKYLIIISFFTLFAFESNSQNFIPNSSFEDTIVHNFFGIYDFSYDSTRTSCWTSINRTYHFLNCINVRAYAQWLDELPPRSGNSKVYIRQLHHGNPYYNLDSTNDMRTYIQTKLTQPLTIGQSYEFKMYVSTGYYAPTSQAAITSLQNLGVHFSDERFLDTTTLGRVNLIPQISFSGINFYSIPNTWMELSATYTAQGGERYVTIGNFDYAQDLVFVNAPFGLDSISSEVAQAAILLDDLSLIPLGSTDSSYLKINLGNDTTFCDSVNITLTAQSGFESYLWSNGATSQSIHITEPGIYWCTTEEFCTTCKDSIIISLQPPKTINLGNDTSFCLVEDYSIQLYSGLGFSSYLWSTGHTGTSIYADTAGTYTVQATYLCGTVYDTIKIITIPKPDPPALFDTAICLNTNYIIADIANLRWYESFTDSISSSTYPDIITTEPNQYSLFVSQVVNSCESDIINFEVNVIDKPSFFFPDSTITCFHDTLYLGPVNNYNFIWNNGNNTSPLLIQNEGIYILEATNQCGNFIDSTIVSYIDCYCTVFIPNTFTPNNDLLNDSFKVIYECDFQDFELSIYNRWGELIFHSFDPTASWDGTFQSKVVQNDVYLVKIGYTNKIDNNEKHINNFVHISR